MDTKELRWGGDVSPVGAGFLGAGLTVFVIGVLMMIVIASGWVRVERKKLIGRASSNASSGGSDLVVCYLKELRSALLRLTSPCLNRIIKYKAAKNKRLRLLKYL